MSRKNNSRSTGKRPSRLFEYKGYWIRENESGRTGYFKCWMHGRNVKRSKLIAENLEDACAELIRDVESHPTAAGSPDTVMFAAIIRNYRDRVLISKRKVKIDEKTGEERHVRGSTESGLDLTVERLTAFMSDDGPDGKPRSPNRQAFTCGEMTLKNQHGFFRHLSEVHGLSARAISIYMATISAAVNIATKPYIKIVDGVEREIQILTHPVTIVTDDKSIAEVINKPNTRAAQTFRPLLSFKEMARIIDKIPEESEHAFRYFVIAMNTWARPEAIHDLNFREQIDFEYDLVYLNPKGRVQTKKYRPIIRLTDNLRAWANQWGEEYPMVYREKRVMSAKKPINKAFEDGGFDGYSRYEIRAFMFNQVRRVILPGGGRLPKDQRSEWMGHVSQEGSATGAYYERFDPDFLQEAKDATDLVIQEVNQHLKIRSLQPQKIENRTTNIIRGAFGS